MNGTLGFIVGFAAGWVSRSALDPSRPARVQVVALALDALDRIKRAVAIEFERVEDLVAEARDRVSRMRADRTRTETSGARVEHAA